MRHPDSTTKTYLRTIADVLQGEAFLDIEEDIREAVGIQLRTSWSSKLAETKVLGGGNKWLWQNADDDTGESSEESDDADAGRTKSQGQGSSSQCQGRSSQGQGSSSVGQKSTLTHIISSERAASVPIGITVPGSPSDRNFDLHVPAASIHSGHLREVLMLPTIQATLQLPYEEAVSTLQGLVSEALRIAGKVGVGKGKGKGLGSKKWNSIPQIDGEGDSSEGDDDESQDDDDDDKHREESFHDLNDEDFSEDTDPLNSGDNLTDSDDDEKVKGNEDSVICRYDKISRTRNKWTFQLNKGIMNIGGRDYVFQRANGIARW